MAIACPDCGTIQEIPPLPAGALAICAGCEERLERTSGRSIAAGFALGLSTLILLIPTNLLTLLSVQMAGAERRSILSSGAVVIWDQGWILLAILIALCGVALPVVRFTLLSMALGAVWLDKPVWWRGPVFRWALALGPWSMPDVFLVGCIIGYTRVVAYLPVHIGPGGWCFIAAAFLSMLTDATLERRAVWRSIERERPVPPGAAISCASCNLILPASCEGKHCPRCRRRLRARRPDAMVRTAALVGAGLLLYAPANLYPMTRLLRFDGTEDHTIFAGILQLVSANLWPLAILIFCTSIGIPMLKLVGLTWLMISIRRSSKQGLIIRTKLHRIIDRVGRWSNIDVFTIAVFAPLMQFGPLASVRAGAGALAFMLVVLLTMLASQTFDPRLMWDAVEADR